MWRRGTTTATAGEGLTFAYSLDATNLTTGTFTTVPGLAFNSPRDACSVTQNVATVGNNTECRQLITATITGLTVANGQAVWIRWTDLDTGGSDDGMAIDDVNITVSTDAISIDPTATGSASPSPVAPGQQTTLSGTITPGQNPTSASFSVSCNLTAIGGSATAVTSGHWHDVQRRGDGRSRHVAGRADAAVHGHRRSGAFVGIQHQPHGRDSAQPDVRRAGDADQRRAGPWRHEPARRTDRRRGRDRHFRSPGLRPVERLLSLGTARDPGQQSGDLGRPVRLREQPGGQPGRSRAHPRNDRGILDEHRLARLEPDRAELHLERDGLQHGSCPARAGDADAAGRCALRPRARRRHAGAVHRSSSW